MRKLQTRTYIKGWCIMTAVILTPFIYLAILWVVVTIEDREMRK